MDPEKLGPFTIVRVLGRGGMGAVYEGTCETDDSTVALKVLTDTFGDDEEVRLRFETEIETLKRLHHPNIVRLSGFGDEQGRLYYVMEYVDGSSLQQELRQKRVFQWEEIAKIGHDLCLALRHAHDRGVIHRDIKPANILISQEGEVKLSDFGIARFFGARQITDVTSIVGTLEYMSPEQAQANPISAASDLYSLGCVLYALLTGKPPFPARSLPELLRKHKSIDPVSIRLIRQEVPEDFEHIIADLLHIRPEDRPRNASLVIKRLQSLMRSSVEDPSAIKVLPKLPDVPKQPQELPAFPCTVQPEANEPDDRDKGVLLANTVTSLSTPHHVNALMEQSQDFATDASESQPQEIPLSPSKSSSHFVAVTTQHFDPFEEEEPSRPLFSLTTVLVSTTLMVVGLTVYFLIQPVPPDVLYARIVATIKEDESAEGYSPALLRSAQVDIEDFLSRYPNHPSAKQVRIFQDELDLLKHERRLERRMQSSALRSLSPVERAYVNVLTSSPHDPKEMIDQLRAFIAVFQSSASSAEGSQRPTSSLAEICVELARRRLKKLEHTVDEISAEQAEVLRRRLDEAEAMGITNPIRAEEIRRGIVKLYQNQPWAKNLVDETKQQLGE